jgi:putative flavoprotein involved in K+ transport
VGAQIRLAVRQLDPSGFYIDVGASELIIDGHVAVRSGVSVVAIRERSLVLCDGAEQPAELIVYATGYWKLRQAGAILSSEIIQKLGPIGGIGSGLRRDHGPWAGEIRNGVEADAATGSLVSQRQFGLMRFFSRILALQIKAHEAGLPTPVYGLA